MGQGRVALVVEDSTDFQQAIAEALSRLGEYWAVQLAATGGEALSLIKTRAFRPDIALVDLGLPDMSGISIVRAARSRYPKMPIMVVSMLDGSDHVLAAIRAGTHGYLHKGDAVGALSEAIQHVLAGGHPISPSLARYLFNLVQAEPSQPEEPGTLSPRETQLLRLLAQGFTYPEAAEQMGVSVPTAKTFSRRIHQKLQVSSKVKALVAARERGLI
jgi:DNA-binding NarL/FixJ family response regulator